MGRDGNLKDCPRAWPVKACCGAGLVRLYLDPFFSGPRGMDLCGIGPFAGRASLVLRDIWVIRQSSSIYLLTNQNKREAI